MGRGFWSRARKFSESAKPAPATSLLAGTTGADSGSLSANCGQKGGDTDSIQNQQRPSPPSTHSAGGGVCCVMLAAQVHYDRWATLAVIAVFLCGFAVAAIRANRSSRPTTPPRGPFAGHGNRKASD